MNNSVTKPEVSQPRHEPVRKRIKEGHSVFCNLNAVTSGEFDKCSCEYPAKPRPNYWTEADAKGDIELPRCVHGAPRNIFCEVCDG